MLYYSKAHYRTLHYRLLLTSIFRCVDCDGAVGGASLKNSTVASSDTTHSSHSTSIRFIMPFTSKLSSSFAVKHPDIIYKNYIKSHQLVRELQYK